MKDLEENKSTVEDIIHEKEPIISKEEVEEIVLDHIGDGEIIQIEHEVMDGSFKYLIQVETEDGPFDMSVDGNDGHITESGMNDDRSSKEEEDDIDGEENLEKDERPYRNNGRNDISPFAIMIAVGITVLLIIAAIGAVLLTDDDTYEGDPFDNTGNDIASTDPLDAIISELMPSEEWFEIYIQGEGPLDMRSWKFTTFDEPMIELPIITGLDRYDFIIVHTGFGTNDLDVSDGRASIYLGLEDNIFSDNGDEIGLFDGDDNIVDFVGWGIGNGDTPRDGWSLEDYLGVPEYGRSLSIHGSDRNADSYWISSPPSPGSFNVLEVNLSPDDEWVAHIINGRRETYHPRYDPGLNMTEPFTVPEPAVNVSLQVPAGQPVSGNDTENVSEYIDFTYKLMKKMGFGEAKSSGNDSDGKPIINVVVTKGGSYSGVCKFDGTIHVDLGSNRVTNKKLVEHEMTHNFQMNDDNGYRHIGPDSKRMVEEGMAEFIGRISTMKNYNMTWSEVEKELQDSGNLNIYDHSSNPHINIFTDWWKATARTYYAHAWEYYELAFLFYKFLFDKFGPSIVPAIFNNTRYGGGHNSVGKDAIEAATGENLEDLVREFMLYRLENRFPQYKNDPRFRPLKPDRTADFTGSPASTGDEWVERYGSRINRFIMKGRNGIIEFKPHTTNSRWGITIISIRPDGSRKYENHTLQPGRNGSFSIPPGYEEIIIIKTLLNGTVESPYEWFNMTVKPDPVITPMGPTDNDHIMWDPDPDYIRWLLENLTGEMELELLVDNTSTFSHPHYNWTMSYNTTSWPIPDDIQNGTWWWKLRWKTDIITGPWTDPWNFTVWRDFDRPEIIWDPEPFRFENSSGSWLLLIQGMQIRIEPISIPAGMDPGPGYGEIRFQGPNGPSSISRFPLGEYFEVPEPEEYHDIMEWRVVYDYFEPWPWFRDDILWDPSPPAIELIQPLPPERANRNTTVGVGVNDTCKMDSFFDIYYTIDHVTWQRYDIEPVLNMTADQMWKYDIFLNLSEFNDGQVTFNISVRDLYGRSSNSLLFDIEVDLDAPEFVIETNPPGDPPVFNDSFEIRVWTDDHTADRVIVEIHDSEEGVTPVEVVVPLPPWTHAMEWRGFVDISTQEIPDGPIIILVILHDDIGNEISKQMDCLIDTIPPEISILEPVEGTVWYPGSEHQVTVDTFEDQTIFRSILEVRVVLRCLENLTEAFNGTLEWIHTGIFEGNLQVPYWADNTTPWQIEIHATDTGGNTGSVFTRIEIGNMGG